MSLAVLSGDRWVAGENDPRRGEEKKRGSEGESAEAGRTQVHNKYVTRPGKK